MKITIDRSKINCDPEEMDIADFIEAIGETIQSYLYKYSVVEVVIKRGKKKRGGK